MSHHWPAQDIDLEYWAPTEFRHPEMMDASFMERLDELRGRCRFPIASTSGARDDADMDRIYGPDRSKWPDSAHWTKGGIRKAKGIDIEPAGDLSGAERRRRKMVIAAEALWMWRLGRWPGLGLEVCRAHLHLDESSSAPRPLIWPGEDR